MRHAIAAGAVVQAIRKRDMRRELRGQSIVVASDLPGAKADPRVRPTSNFRCGTAPRQATWTANGFGTTRCRRVPWTGSLGMLRCG